VREAGFAFANIGGAGGGASTLARSMVTVSKCDSLSGVQYRREYVKREGSCDCGTANLTGAVPQPESNRQPMIEQASLAFTPSPAPIGVLRAFPINLFSINPIRVAAVV